MRVFFIVHGFVQGVGYRSLVKRIAIRNNVFGMVKNASDGSVHIMAEADSDSLARFEKEIEVRMEHGPDVHVVERINEQDQRFPKDIGPFEKFVIDKTD